MVQNTFFIPTVLFCLAVVQPLFLQAASDVHSQLKLLPAESSIQVDGVLNDWDTEAGILASRDPDGDPYHQSAWMYGMYDQDAIYLAFRIFDSSPLSSTVNPDVSVFGWLGDCIQLRFRSEIVTHLTTWWYTPNQRPAVHVAGGEDLKEPREGLLGLLGATQLWGGVEMAVEPFDSPTPGYIQEMRIPWSFITRDGKRPASARIGMLIQIFFDGVENMLFEMIAEDAGIERMLYEQPQKWGEAVLVQEVTQSPQLDELVRDRWEAVTVPQIGTLTDVTFLDAKHGFASGKHGILNTRNGGRSWLHTDIPAYAMWEMDFPTSEVGYAVGMGAPSYARKAGVVMTTRDGGEHWEDLEKDFPVRLRCLDFADENAGWVAGDYAIYYTANGGSDWSQGFFVPSKILEVVALDSSRAIALLDNKSVLLTEDGRSWRSLASVPIQVSHITKASETSVVIAAGKQGIVRSVDQGASWDYRSLPIDVNEVQDLQAYDEQRWALLALVGDRQNIYETMDGGKSWNWLYAFTPSAERLQTVNLESLAYVDQDLWAVGGGMVMTSQVSLAFRYGEGVLTPETSVGVVPIQYTLETDSFVTLVIEDEQGRRVRNLFNDQARSAGDNVDYWDGYNDKGELMPSGSYQWRGLTHEGLHTFFEFVYYNPGNPPWNTADNRGNWGSDHTPPQDVATSGDNVILCWPFYEAGSGVVVVDLNGQRRWAAPHRAIMGNGHWGGASARVDADTDHVYVALQYDGKVGFYRLRLEDGEIVPFVWTENGKKHREIDRIAYQRNALATFEGEEIPHVWDALKSKSLDIRHALHGDRENGNNLSGLAVGEQYLVMALWPDNSLYVVDKKTGQDVREIALKHPGGIDFAPDGRTLYAISDGGLVRVDLESGHVVTLIPADSHLLDKPVEISCGLDGQLYVSDWGASMQVRVFTAEGRPLRSIGHSGGRAIEGPYDPAGMLSPMGTALDRNGKLWVAEYVYTPKRFSVWNAESTQFESEYLGPTIYGGEGPVVCEWDKSIAFAPGMQFQLDWDLGDYQLTDVFSRAESDANALFGGPSINFIGMGGGPAKWSIYPNSGKFLRYEGREFFLQRSPFPVLYEQVDGIWQPRAAIGTTHFFGRRNYWSDKYILDAIPGYEFSSDATISRGGGKDSKTLGIRSKTLPEFNFIWSDHNGDGMSQRDEFELIPLDDAKPGTLHFRWNGLGAIGDDMTIYTPIAKFPFSGFHQNGAPMYNMQDASVLPARGDVLATADHRVISMSKTLAAYDADGLDLQWSVPNPYEGVAGSHKAPSPHRGQFVGSFNITNDAPLDHDLGRIFHVTGNHGQHFLFTTDGLYLSTLFSDSRTGASHPSEFRRNMNMDNTSFSQEGWSGYFWRDQESGNYYVIGGKTDYRICRVEGIETIQRLDPVAFELTAEEHVSASNLVVEKRDGYLYKVSDSGDNQDAQDELLKISSMPQPPLINGDSSDWPAMSEINAVRVSADVRQSAQVRLHWDQDHLYLLYEVSDPTPWTNSGKSFDSLFLSGDAVDLMLRTDTNAAGGSPQAGDLRLLFADLEGEPVAVLYEAGLVGEEDPITFVGVNNAIFGDVRKLGTAEIAVERRQDGYVLEASVPWRELGLSPSRELILRGDVGLLFSDSLGVETSRRVYLYNQNTQVVSDVGSEALLQPENWGMLQFD